MKLDGASMLDLAKFFMARLFAAMFLTLAGSLAALSVAKFIGALSHPGGDQLITGFIGAINTAFISLATFELGTGIGKEYSTREDGDNLYQVVRRTITRFVSVVCTALVLEALIMVIKYSQLELAGNLYYPVAILGGASMLLISLGGFLHVTRAEAGQTPRLIQEPVRHSSAARAYEQVPRAVGDALPDTRA